jgi:hypothetical protein
MIEKIKYKTHKSILTNQMYLLPFGLNPWNYTNQLIHYHDVEYAMNHQLFQVYSSSKIEFVCMVLWILHPLPKNPTSRSCWITSPNHAPDPDIRYGFNVDLLVPKDPAQPHVLQAALRRDPALGDRTHPLVALEIAA